MGIKGLLNVLRPITSRQPLSTFSGTIMAVDASTWIHHAKSSCSIELSIGFSPQIYISILHSRLKKIIDAGIHPIFIFDGSPLPNKHLTAVKRSENSHNAASKGFEYLSKVSSGVSTTGASDFILDPVLGPVLAPTHARNTTQTLIDLAMIQFKRISNRSTFQTIAFQSLLSSLNIPWINAPYEADAQIGYLYQKGLINGVLGEDSDYILFGCALILLKLDSNNFVDVIDLRAPAINTVVNAYEIAKKKHEIFCNEARLLQYCRDPLVSFHFQQFLTTSMEPGGIEPKDEDNTRIQATKTVFKMFSQLEPNSPNILLQSYLNDDFYFHYEYDLYKQDQRNLKINADAGLPASTDDEQIVQVIPVTIKPDHFFTNQAMQEILTSYPQLNSNHAPTFTSFISRNSTNPTAFSSRVSRKSTQKTNRTAPSRKKNSSNRSTPHKIPKKHPIDLFDDKAFEFDQHHPAHPKQPLQSPKSLLKAKFVLSSDSSSFTSDVSDLDVENDSICVNSHNSKANNNSSTSINAFAFMQSKQRQLKSERKALEMEKELKRQEKVELEAEKQRARQAREQAKLLKQRKSQPKHSSSSRNNKPNKDGDLNEYMTNFANLSSTSTTSSSNSSNSSLFSSTATTSTSPSTSSTDYSSMSDGDDSGERPNQRRRNNHINKNQRNCPLAKAQEMTTHATHTNNHNIHTNIVEDDHHDDDDDLDEMLSSISSPTKRPHSKINLQIDSDDNHDELETTHHHTSRGHAVKKQRTLDSMFVTKTVPKSEVNRKDNDIQSTQHSHDPFQSQLDPFAFSSQETTTNTAKPSTCTPIGRKTKDRHGKQESTTTTLPTSLTAPPKQLSATPSPLPRGRAPITIDSDHNDEDLSQLAFSKLTASISPSPPFHPSSHSISASKHSTFLSSYHPNIFVHKTAYQLSHQQPSSQFIPLDDPSTTCIASSKLLSTSLVSIHDGEFIDPNYSPLSLTQLLASNILPYDNSLPATSPTTTTDGDVNTSNPNSPNSPNSQIDTIPISNALTESLTYNRLNSALTPHKLSLRKAIATSPFIFLGTKPLPIPSDTTNTNTTHKPHSTPLNSKVLKSVADWKYVMQLFSLDHFQFLEVSVLAGCDYLPSMPGIGFKNALSLYCKHGSAHKVIDAWYEDVLRRFQNTKKNQPQPSHSKRNGKKVDDTDTVLQFDNEDEFHIRDSDVEWSDDDEYSLETKSVGPNDKVGSNTGNGAKSRRKVKSKYSAFETIDDCVEYFTNYHTDFDTTVISYLYQHVIDPLRARFTHVNDLFQLNDLLSATLSTTSPISPQLSFLRFSNQRLALGLPHTPNSSIHHLPPLQNRSQSALFPMLSYFLSQTCSTDDLYGIWASLSSTRADPTQLTPHHNSIRSNLSNTLATTLLHHMDREYVGFQPRAPQFILHSNISTCFPITLNFSTITPINPTATSSSASKTSRANRNNNDPSSHALHTYPFLNTLLPINDPNITLPTLDQSALSTPSPNALYPTDVFLNHLHHQLELHLASSHSTTSVIPLPLSNATSDDLKTLRSRLFKHTYNGLPSPSLAHEDQAELESLFQLNSSFLNFQRNCLHSLTTQQRSHLFPKSIIYLATQLYHHYSNLNDDGIEVTLNQDENTFDTDVLITNTPGKPSKSSNLLSTPSKMPQTTTKPTSTSTPSKHPYRTRGGIISVHSHSNINIGANLTAFQQRKQCVLGKLQKVINKYVEFNLSIGPALPHSLAKDILVGNLDPHWLVYSNPRHHPLHIENKHKIYQFSWANVFSAMLQSFQFRHQSIMQSLSQQYPAIKWNENLVIGAALSNTDNHNNATLVYHPNTINATAAADPLAHLSRHGQQNQAFAPVAVSRYNIAARLHYQLLHLFSQSSIPLPFSLRAPIKVDHDRFNNFQSNAHSSLRLHHFLNQTGGFSHDMLTMVKQTMKELPHLTPQSQLSTSSHSQIISITRPHNELSWVNFPVQYLHQIHQQSPNTHHHLRSQHSQNLPQADQQPPDTSHTPHLFPPPSTSLLSDHFMELPEREQLARISLLTSPHDLREFIQKTTAFIADLDTVEEQTNFQMNFDSQMEDLHRISEERHHLRNLTTACKDRLSTLQPSALSSPAWSTALHLNSTSTITLPPHIRQEVKFSSCVSQDTLAFISFHYLIATLTNLPQSDNLDQNGTDDANLEENAKNALMILFQTAGLRLEHHPHVAALLYFFRLPISLSISPAPRYTLKTLHTNPINQSLPKSINLSTFGLFASVQSLRLPFSTSPLLSLLPTFHDEATLNSQQFLINQSLTNPTSSDSNSPSTSTSTHPTIYNQSSSSTPSSDLITKRRVQTTLKHLALHLHKSFPTYTLSPGTFASAAIFQDYTKAANDNIDDHIVLPLTSLLLHSDQEFDDHENQAEGDQFHMFRQRVDHVIAGNGDAISRGNLFVNTDVQTNYTLQSNSVHQVESNSITTSTKTPINARFQSPSPITFPLSPTTLLLLLSDSLAQSLKHYRLPLQPNNTFNTHTPQLTHNNALTLHSRIQLLFPILPVSSPVPSSIASQFTTPTAAFSTFNSALSRILTPAQSATLKLFYHATLIGSHRTFSAQPQASYPIWSTISPTHFPLPPSTPPPSTDVSSITALYSNRPAQSQLSTSQFDGSSSSAQNQPNNTDYDDSFITAMRDDIDALNGVGHYLDQEEMNIGSTFDSARQLNQSSDHNQNEVYSKLVQTSTQPSNTKFIENTPLKQKHTTDYNTPNQPHAHNFPPPLNSTSSDNLNQNSLTDRPLLEFDDGLSDLIGDINDLLEFQQRELLCQMHELEYADHIRKQRHEQQRQVRREMKIQQKQAEISANPRQPDEIDLYLLQKDAKREARRQKALQTAGGFDNHSHTSPIHPTKTDSADSRSNFDFADFDDFTPASLNKKHAGKTRVPSNSSLFAQFSEDGDDIFSNTHSTPVKPNQSTSSSSKGKISKQHEPNPFSRKQQSSNATPRSSTNSMTPSHLTPTTTASRPKSLLTVLSSTPTPSVAQSKPPPSTTSSPFSALSHAARKAPKLFTNARLDQEHDIQANRDKILQSLARERTKEQVTEKQRLYYEKQRTRGNLFFGAEKKNLFKKD